MYRPSQPFTRIAAAKTSPLILSFPTKPPSCARTLRLGMRSQKSTQQHSSPSAGQTCGPNLSLLPVKIKQMALQLVVLHIFDRWQLGSTILLTDLKSSAGLYFSTSPPNLVTSSSSHLSHHQLRLHPSHPPTASISVVSPANFDAQRRAVKKEPLSIRPSRRNCCLSDTSTACRWTQRA